MALSAKAIEDLKNWTPVVGSGFKSLEDMIEKSGGWEPRIKALSNGLLDIGGAVAAFAPPVGAAITAIGAVGVVSTMAYEHFHKTTDAAKALAGGMTGVGHAAKDSATAQAVSTAKTQAAAAAQKAALAAAQQEQAAYNKKSTTLQHLMTVQDKLTKQGDKASAAQKKQVADEIKSITGLNMAYKTTEDKKKALAKLEEQLTKTKSQAVRDRLKLQITELQGSIKTDDEMAKSAAEAAKARADAFKDYDQQIADAAQKGGQGLVDLGKKIGAQLIQDTANTYAGKLELAAAADILLNPVLGAAELAGAIAIRTAASAIAGALGGGSGSGSGGGSGATSRPSTTPATSTSSGSSSDSSGGDASSGTQPSAQIQVVFQGGIIDPQTIDRVGKLLSDRVQTGNMTLVASHVAKNGVVVPTA